MRAYVLQHVPFEDIGNIRYWLNQQQAEIHYCRIYANEPLPDLDAIDLLIVLGGPMSANDESHYPWLKAFWHRLLQRKNRLSGSDWVPS